MLWLSALHWSLDAVSAVALFMLAMAYVDRHTAVPTAWHFFASAAFACGATAEVAHSVLAIFAAPQTEQWAPGAWYAGLAIKAILLGFGFGASWMQMHRSIPSRIVLSVLMVAAASVVSWAAAIEFMGPGTEGSFHTFADVLLIGVWLGLAILAMRMPMMRALSPTGIVEFCVMMALAHVVMSMTSYHALDNGFLTAHLIKIAGYGPLLRLYISKPDETGTRLIDPSEGQVHAALRRLEDLAGARDK